MCIVPGRCHGSSILSMKQAHTYIHTCYRWVGDYHFLWKPFNWVSFDLETLFMCTNKPFRLIFTCSSLFLFLFPPPHPLPSTSGGIHMLIPHPGGGGGSPPSSPSNTPISNRRPRTSSRKSRLKSRSRKQSKPQLASADISTQESTTQGKGHSSFSHCYCGGD